MQLNWSRIAVGASMAVIAGAGFWNIFQTTPAQASTGAEFALVSQNLKLVTEPGATLPVVVAIKNTGSGPWSTDLLQLGTVFSTGDPDRPSVWKSQGWVSDTRIAMPVKGQLVYPNQIALFSFNMQAPKYGGLYKEYMLPLINGWGWLKGEPIVIDIQVGADVQIQTAPEAKEVRIFRSTQQANWLENGYVVATLPVSSGRAGYETPAGQYTIFNHISNAYSSEYELWMPSWMGLSSVKNGFRGYGLHALPYWKVNSNHYVEGKIYPGGRLYTQGRLYEGYSHLGRPVSHGCVRFGVDAAAVMFAWAPDGMPVTII